MRAAAISSASGWPSSRAHRSMAASTRSSVNSKNRSALRMRSHNKAIAPGSASPRNSGCQAQALPTVQGETPPHPSNAVAPAEVVNQRKSGARARRGRRSIPTSSRRCSQLSSTTRPCRCESERSRSSSRARTDRLQARQEPPPRGAAAGARQRAPAPGRSSAHHHAPTAFLLREDRSGQSGLADPASTHTTLTNLAVPGALSKRLEIKFPS